MVVSITVAKSLLGKDVNVKLDERVIVRGILLSFAEDGEVVIEDETGVIHWCWPMLDVEEANGVLRTSADTGKEKPETRQEDTAPFPAIA